MKKILGLAALLTLFTSGISAQSADQAISEATPEGNRLEATIICLDAIEAPTKYNAFAKQFINTPGFPKKEATTSEEQLRQLINNWLLANPLEVTKILSERKKAHDKLYGSRPY